MERIQGLKEDLALDELAGLLSPNPAHLRLSAAEAKKRNIVSQAALDLLEQTLGPGDPLDFPRLLRARIVDRLLEAGAVSLDEGALILRTLAAGEGPQGQGLLLFLRKRGVGFALVAQGPCVPDSEAREVARVDLAAQVTALKLELNGGTP